MSAILLVVSGCGGGGLPNPQPEDPEAPEAPEPPEPPAPDASPGGVWQGASLVFGVVELVSESGQLISHDC